jgi:regulator of sigma E protease
VSIIIFLIILSVLIVAHEAGHLWAAKSGGIRVDEFGLGFPPRAKKLFRWRDTDFTLNWLPFGGFVKIFGENPEEGAQVSGDSFAAKSKARQILVLASGVIANFALAWLLFSIVLMLGIESQDGYVQRGFFDAIWHGLLTTGKITWLTVVAIYEIIAGAVAGQADFSGVVGPVGLVGVVGEVSAMGLAYLLYFTAVISVNLAIINLIPVPALDGGRILLTLIEAVKGSRISPKVFGVLNFVSFVLLILLMVLITVRDVGELL